MNLRVLLAWPRFSHDFLLLLPTLGLAPSWPGSFNIENQTIIHMQKGGEGSWLRQENLSLETVPVKTSVKLTKSSGTWMAL